MRGDISLPDLIAFYIASIMLVTMVFALWLLASILYRSAHSAVKPASSTASQSQYGPLRRALKRTCTVFNLSLIGTILGSIVLVTAVLISLAHSHNAWALKGVVPFAAMGGAIFESSYCVYSWSRSKSIIRNQGNFVFWVLTGLAAVNPILFCAPFISSILYEARIVSIQVYRINTISAVTGMFLLDVAMILCFAHFLFKNPAPTASSGKFNGNMEAAKQWRRTEIIAKHGLLSSFLSFVALGILVASQMFPSLNFYVNLLNVCAYTIACTIAVVLLAMKIKLEGGIANCLCQATSQQLPAPKVKKSRVG